MSFTSALGKWRMVYDGRYKAVTGFDPALKKQGEENADGSDRHAPTVLWDLHSDLGENSDISANAPPQGQSLLSLIARPTLPLEL